MLYTTLMNTKALARGASSDSLIPLINAKHTAALNPMNASQ